MENTGIEWTTNTFNPWHGCMKVSPGCANCYAEAQDRRFGPSHWGPNSDRKLMSEKYWDQPHKWNAQAKATGETIRVFCASMADVFEGHPQTLKPLARLFDLIIATPYLTWQLLTKRPENIMDLVPAGWRRAFPSHVWMGTSVENQAAADIRVPHLLCVPADVLFLSCEPLLGPVYLPIDVNDGSAMVHWVIAGGESGPRARPMHINWLRSLRDQCHDSGCAFFFKQWGEFFTDDSGETFQVGKKNAGSVLDGKQYKQFPEFIVD